MTTTADQGTSQAGLRPGVPVDSLANRLILARAMAGHLSIREAAERCGFGRGAWTNWEKGTPPTDRLNVVEVIADKLGVDPDWLLNGGPLNDEPARRRRWTYERQASGHSSGGYQRLVSLRPPDGRPATRPAGNRPPPGPGRTSRVQPITSR